MTTLDRLSQLMQAFQTQSPAPTVSDKYVYISSQTIVDTLTSQGWQLDPTAKAPVRSRSRTHGKHGATFRHPDLQVEVRPGDIITPQITFTNAYDGLSALRFYSGFWRLICSNGLAIPIEDISGVENTYLRIRHINVSADELYRSIADITANLHKSVSTVQTLTQYEMSDKQIREYATNSFLKRQFTAFTAPKDTFDWNQPVHQSVIDALTVSDHKEDRGKTAWEVYNKVQGAIIERGFRAYDPIKARMRKYKALTSFERTSPLNTALFTDIRTVTQ